MGNQAVGYLQGTTGWVSGTVNTNPADQTVLVDSGALTAGSYLFAVVGAGSVAWIYDVQQRDSANATSVDSQRRRPAAGNEDFLFPNKITLASNERVRCILQGAVVGEVQMSLFYMEVG